MSGAKVHPCAGCGNIIRVEDTWCGGCDDPEDREVDLYAKGGHVRGGTTAAVIALDECVLGRDGICRRMDDAHRTTLPAGRFWACPLNDAEPT